MKFIDLQNSKMPALGFGTWQLRGDECPKSIQHALSVGYRHVDTAQIYENEAEVGQGLQQSSVDRGDIFLTTKIWRDKFESKETALASVEESLKKLQTDYVDLLLIHWPFPEHSIEQMVECLVAAQEKGYAKNIGVSNFTVEQMEEAKKYSGGKICVNQVEYHPSLSQEPVLEFCQKNNWCLTAYSPLGRGGNLDNETLQSIAKAHDKSAAQVCLRWLVQQDNVAAIPKSATPANIESNFAIFDFELSEDEMKQIFNLARDDGRLISPDFAPAWDRAPTKKAA